MCAEMPSGRRSVLALPAQASPGPGVPRARSPQGQASPEQALDLEEDGERCLGYRRGNQDAGPWASEGPSPGRGQVCTHHRYLAPCKGLCSIGELLPGPGL